MFFINEQEAAEVRFGNRVSKDANADVQKSKQEANIPQYIRRIVGNDYVNIDARDEYTNQQI